MMLPSSTGTFTFLFSDLEGSTRLWEEHPDAMQAVMARHFALLKDAIGQNDGYLVKTTGDGVHAAFATATDALQTALAAQLALVAEPWPDELPIKVRMGIHTGAAEWRDGDYYGTPLNRAARLMSAGYGGQVLLSGVTAELCRDTLPPDVSLLALGEHRLKDLARPETVYQVNHPALAQTFPPLKTLDYFPNNLPRQITSFVGREREIEQVKGLLSRTHLLTLTGPGGTGKTRLSLQVAADVLEEYPDGVWFVELAPLSDPSLVPQAVAQVLGVKEQPGKSLQQTLIEYLSSKRVLVVLDNCEHVVGASASLAASLLRACPSVRILATSRERLGIAGELTFGVPPLSVPDPKERATPGSLSLFESVRLFIDRAVFHKPAFVVTNANAPSLAELCHRLDGIPLALELAAARIRSLSVEEINARLDSRFRLLTGGDRSALPRQQTLRALIDWSYDLLSDAEKRLLTRQSVFAGGWTMDAAEKVCGFDPVEDWEVLDLLTGLVDKSLALAEDGGSGTRYRMLETVRQYGQERLEGSGEAEVVRGRHRDYFLSLAEEAAPKVMGAEQGQWLATLESEHDNLRQAMAFCLESAGGAEAGLRLAAALWRFWWVRGHLSEGRERLRAALEQAGEPGPSRMRAVALNGAGALASYQGDYASACTLYEQSVAIKRELGDKKGIAASLGNLAIVAREQGDLASARALLEQSREVFRELGDKWSMANTANLLGMVVNAQRDYAEASVLYEESVTLFQELGDNGGVANALHNLGTVFHTQHDLASARTLYERSLALYRGLGDKGNVANSLATFAGLAHLEQQPTRSVCLWGANTALREQTGVPRPPAEQAEYSQQTEQSRAALGDAAFEAAFEQGRAMTLEQAIEYALRE